MEAAVSSVPSLLLMIISAWALQSPHDCICSESVEQLCLIVCVFVVLLPLRARRLDESLLPKHFTQAVCSVPRGLSAGPSACSPAVFLSTYCLFAAGPASLRLVPLLPHLLVCLLMKPCAFLLLGELTNPYKTSLILLSNRSFWSVFLLSIFFYC